MGLLENASSVDEDIHFIKENLTVSIFDLKLPLGSVLIPCCTLDGVLEFDVVLAVIFVHDLVHVLVDLLGSGIIVGPIGLGCKTVGVVVCRNVALAAGISVEGQ